MIRRAWRAIRLLVLVTVHSWLTRRGALRVPESERAAYRAHRQRLGCRIICRTLGIRVTRTGGELPQGAVLGVSNHLGMLDPFLIASQLPVAFAAKAEIASWPAFGTVARAYGVFFVERGRRGGVAPFVEAVQRRLTRGVSVVVFPEGRTNAALELLPFKTGAFEAVTGCPEARVLPLYLHPVTVEGRPAVGAERALVVWADSELSFAQKLWRIMRLRDVHFELHVGRPFDVAGRDRKALAAEAHRRVAALATRALAPAS